MAGLEFLIKEIFLFSNIMMVIPLCEQGNALSDISGAHRLISCVILVDDMDANCGSAMNYLNLCH